ncbi:hypothetical protein B224_1977 [Aeromonas media WS]|nr:hypothetical protein B224_1977 [Aeromonas media WS]
MDLAVEIEGIVLWCFTAVLLSCWQPSRPVTSRAMAPSRRRGCLLSIARSPWVNCSFYCRYEHLWLLQLF